ncbi:MAG: hypothetical protein J3R72DRAFT_426081 [Linnemannia gamsii]|nr:MAG: hypothetical protein J3R72DRAFT_426081 [Linnemannia gamsii]
MAPSRRFIVTCSHHCHCHRPHSASTDENNKDDTVALANTKKAAPSQSILPTPPSSPQLTSSTSSSSSSSGDDSTAPAVLLDVSVLSDCLQDYRHRPRHVLSIEFIHDIEVDSIVDVPWSSPPSPRLTQSLSQQLFKYEHHHEREHEHEHGLLLRQPQEQHQDDHGHDNPTAAPALPIPHCPTFTHGPPCELNAIHIRHPHHQMHQGLSTTSINDYYDEKDGVLEQPQQEPLQPEQGQGPTAQDDANHNSDNDNNSDDVSILVIPRSTAKTEIAASTLSSLLLHTQTQTHPKSSPSPGAVVTFPPFPFSPPEKEEASVPVKLVSAVQGPRRGPQPKDQSASWVCRAAPISGTGTFESESSEAILFSSSCPPAFPFSSIERRDNIFSRRLSEEYQEQRFSFHGYSHLQLDKDKGEDQRDPCGLIPSHQNDYSHSLSNDNNNYNDEGNYNPLPQQQQRTLPCLVPPHEFGLETALEECLGDTTYFLPGSANSATDTSSSSSMTTTSQDDDREVCQHSSEQEDVAISPSSSLPLPTRLSVPERIHLRTPSLVKSVVATTIVTTAFADAVLELNRDRLASPHLQMYQSLLSPPQVAATVFSDRLPPTSPPPPTLQVPSSSSLPDGDDDDQETISPLPPPVAFVVPDNKADIYDRQGPVNLNSIVPMPPIPIILLPGEELEDAIKQQQQQQSTTATPVARAITSTKADAPFLNGWLSGTFSWWTKSAPVPNPADASTTTTTTTTPAPTVST